MLDFIKKIFRRKHTTPLPTGEGERLPLRIEGVAPAPMTPEPDDAELAAEALLASLANDKATKKSRKSRKSDELVSKPARGTAEYYRQLAKRISEGHEYERRMALRFVAFCEERLHAPFLNEEQTASLEQGLYQQIDIVDREGGELKRRWQHCLAEIIVRQMKAERKQDPQKDNSTTDDTDSNE